MVHRSIDSPVNLPAKARVAGCSPVLVHSAVLPSLAPHSTIPAPLDVQLRQLVQSPAPDVSNRVVRGAAALTASRNVDPTAAPAEHSVVTMPAAMARAMARSCVVHRGMSIARQSTSAASQGKCALASADA